MVVLPAGIDCHFGCGIKQFELVVRKGGMCQGLKQSFERKNEKKMAIQLVVLA